MATNIADAIRETKRRVLPPQYQPTEESELSRLRRLSHAPTSAWYSVLRVAAIPAAILIAYAIAPFIRALAS